MSWDNKDRRRKPYVEIVTVKGYTNTLHVAGTFMDDGDERDTVWCAWRRSISRAWYILDLHEITTPRRCLFPRMITALTR